MAADIAKARSNAPGASAGETAEIDTVPSRPPSREAALSRSPAQQALPAPQPLTSVAAPRLSVVVPTCGRPALLLRCLQALVAQRIDDDAFEIIVVDDGHDDVTREQVGQLAVLLPSLALRYLRPRHGKGPAVARNVGWRAARGAIVAFTDDDTIPDPDWLAEGEKALRDQRLAAVAGRVVVPRPAGADAAPTDHEKMTRGLETTEFITANAFVRRAALFSVHGFDERFTRAWREDSDLQFRLEADAGGRAAVGRCETARVQHPVRAEAWGLSLRQQKNAFFEALLYRQHRQQYRDRISASAPLRYYAIVLLSVLTAVLTVADVMGSAAVSGAIALALVLRFAFKRLRGTSHQASHVAEMLVTSALIPFLSVYWRLRGAWHFRVWFW